MGIHRRFTTNKGGQTMSFGKDPMLGRKGDNNKNGKNIDECISRQLERVS